MVVHEMADVFFRACEVVVQADDLMTFRKQPLAQIGSQKARPPCNQYPFLSPLPHFTLHRNSSSPPPGPHGRWPPPVARWPPRSAPPPLAGMPPRAGPTLPDRTATVKVVPPDRLRLPGPKSPDPR